MAALPKSDVRSQHGASKKSASPQTKVADAPVTKRVRAIRGDVTASKAKAHFLQLLETVDRERSEITITKRGRKIARLVPIEDESTPSIFGCMKGTFKITGDIVGPEPDVWEAMSE
ncbi:MAG: type II toxin-antitoxin system prevent-host-death family antitoxin [Acidobacteria bacterium]|nr:type II toxin-antitoxin system prevent-host-death family antitoxin [Acidobacteriota bacterium]